MKQNLLNQVLIIKPLRKDIAVFYSAKTGRRITTDNGIVIVESGADITEEVLQKAKLANKFVELSMNVQKKYSTKKPLLVRRGFLLNNA